MNQPHMHSAAAETTAKPDAASLATGDEREAPDASPRYCPTRLLASFALLMAGHGRCVITDMMLGDREYAMWQLACARATEDAELRDVAARLCAYFDEPQHEGVAVMGTA